MDWIIAGVVLTVLVVMSVVGYLLDRHVWNGGICAKNGLPWEVRDVDSQGGFLLRAGDEYTWLNGWVRPDL